MLRTVLPEQDELIGQSPVMLKFQELLARVAPTDVWVLLTGENGTGKELAARALHAGSRKRARSPARIRPGPDASKWRTTARCSSTKSGT